MVERSKNKPKNFCTAEGAEVRRENHEHCVCKNLKLKAIYHRVHRQSSPSLAEGRDFQFDWIGDS